MNGYLIFENSPVFHVLRNKSDWYSERIPEPLCGSMTGPAYQTKVIDKTPNSLCLCGNCNRIIHSRNLTFARH